MRPFDMSIKMNSVSIEIDDVTYTDFTVVSSSRNIVVSIILPVEFEAGNANKQFDVTGITYLRNGEEKNLRNQCDWYSLQIH